MLDIGIWIFAVGIAGVVFAAVLNSVPGAIGAAGMVAGGAIFIAAAEICDAIKER